MSRWYDNHRIEKRLRNLERMQLIGAELLERVTERVVYGPQPEQRSYKRNCKPERDAHNARETDRGSRARPSVCIAAIAANPCSIRVDARKRNDINMERSLGRGVPWSGLSRVDGLRRRGGGVKRRAPRRAPHRLARDPRRIFQVVRNQEDEMAQALQERLAAEFGGFDLSTLDRMKPEPVADPAKVLSDELSAKRDRQAEAADQAAFARRQKAVA